MTNTNSRERIKEQMIRYRSDDPAVSAKALEEILEDHKKFITHIINKHFSSYKNQWFEDLYSCGVIGLIESLPKYDPDKSMPTTHFGRYIIHEIYDFIAKFVQQTTTHYASKLAQINRAIAELEREGIENPTIVDIAMKSGIKPEIVMKALSIQTAAQSKSIESEEYISNLMSDSREQPDEIVEQQEGIEIMYRAIQNLPYKMREVVLRRNGLCGYEMQSNEVISRETGIPLNQIRRVYAKALKMLRESEMKDFYSGGQPLAKREEISLVPEAAASTMIAAIVEVDVTEDDIALL